MAQRGGFAILPQRMLHDKSIPQGAKMTYLALSSFVGDSDEVWPSHSTLADLTGSSISSVQRSLKWLREAGWVAWRPGANEETNAQTSNRYVVHTEPTPPVRVTDPPSQGDRRTRTTEQEPTKTSVVEVVSEVKSQQHLVEELTTPRGKVWVPDAAAAEEVVAVADELRPIDHLTHYRVRCYELDKRPNNREWVRWFIADQQKLRNDIKANAINNQEEYADDGTPNSWKL